MFNKVIIVGITILFIGCASETKGLMKSPCAFNQTHLSFNDLEEK